MKFLLYAVAQLSRHLGVRQKMHWAVWAMCWSIVMGTDPP